ncbi:uncharacterized protein LOC135226489 isoform X1 [Macrobrachium nipponense]|uniref:uncharacterized protein LOC135226489 isoform X1 n=1 Tax=Macrobrachium nipponense TaxID=159736 RepID=UPI0030C89A80
MYSILSYAMFLGTIGATTGLNIARLSVPRVVQANTTSVVLDCDYVVEEWERDGLVVKWNVDSVHLVYQWIPPLKPQALGTLSGRVNTSYEASIYPWAKHRAIHIPRPDPSLSGKYSCTVSTFEDEDTRESDMLVWTPAKVLDLKYWRPSFYDVQITCSADGIFPRPVFYLYTKHVNWSRQEVHVMWRSVKWHEGLLNASATGLISWEQTERDTIIGCTLTLPGTPHAKTLTKVFTPDLPVVTTTTTTTTTTTLPPTTKGHRARGWSNGSHHVPNSTNNYFGFTDMFGAVSGGVERASTAFLQAPLTRCGLLLISFYLAQLSTATLL